MSTYSQDLRIELIGTGAQAGTWGSTTNNNFQYILEQAIAGWQQVPITSTNQVLTYLNGATSTANLNQSIYAMLSLTGGSANFNVFTPNGSAKTYIINNTSSYAATIAVSSAGSATTPAGATVTIPSLQTVTVYTDGTNFYPQNSYLPGTPTAPTATTGTNTTQIATTAFVQTTAGAINSVLTGSIQMWPTTSAPSGYLLCNGNAVSRTSYAALFAVMGTTFGAGDGSTTFNLPNYTNNFPVGAGSSYSLASTGGATSVTLSTANIPAHSHSSSGLSASSNTSVSLTDPGHQHYVGSRDSTAQDGGAYTQEFVSNYNNTSNGPSTYTNFTTTGISVSSATTTTTISGSTGSIGSGTAFNTVPPYLAIYFIVKT